MRYLPAINDDFKKHLRTLVPRLLDSNNLVLKSINGQPVTCRELLEYFKVRNCRKELMER